jgi:cytochrome c556
VLVTNLWLSVALIVGATLPELIPTVWMSAQASGVPVSQDEIAAPPDDEAMRKFMARKLVAAQRALQHVAIEDFAGLKQDAEEMIALSRQEAWERMASARFVQDTVDFVNAAEFLIRMADLQDPEGTALGYSQLTMTCAACHGHLRRTAVARREMNGSGKLAATQP